MAHSGKIRRVPEGSGEFRRVPGMSSKSLKIIWNYTVFGDFGQALDKYATIVTGIGQIYAASDRNSTNIR